MNDDLVDANIILALLNPIHRRHQDVADLVAHRGTLRRLVAPPQSWYETYVVLTRPHDVNGYAMSPSHAVFEIETARLQFAVLPDPPELLDAWLDLCREHGVSGKPAHDARLAAYARLHGIGTLVTLNARDFARYGLSVVVP